MNFLAQAAARKQSLRQAEPGAYIKQRIADAAASLNRSGSLALRVELANEAMCALTELLYAKDSDGRAVNVDRKTARLRIPAPWGEKGWRTWGLRHHEAVTLRRILRARQQGSIEPLFYCEGNGWYLNARSYKSKTTALAYLKAYPISDGEWRTHDATKNATKGTT